MLLHVAIHHCGVKADSAAAAIFEAYISSFASVEPLNDEMQFSLQLIQELMEKEEQQQQAAPPSAADVVPMEHCVGIVERQAALISMLKVMLEARSFARKSFRSCGGWDILLRGVLSWRNTLTDTATNSSSQIAVKLSW